MHLTLCYLSLSISNLTDKLKDKTNTKTGSFDLYLNSVLLCVP